MIQVPVTTEDLSIIQKTYGEIVADHCRKDTEHKTPNHKNLAVLQELVNQYAIKLYDKHGRIILRVGEDDYLDITCPIIQFQKDKENHGEAKVMVTFRETNPVGEPK